MRGMGVLGIGIRRWESWVEVWREWRFVLKGSLGG